VSDLRCSGFCYLFPSLPRVDGFPWLLAILSWTPVDLGGPGSPVSCSGDPVLAAREPGGKEAGVMKTPVDSKAGSCSFPSPLWRGEPGAAIWHHLACQAVLDLHQTPGFLGPPLMGVGARPVLPHPPSFGPHPSSSRVWNPLFTLTSSPVSPVLLLWSSWALHAEKAVPSGWTVPQGCTSLLVYPAEGCPDFARRKLGSCIPHAQLCAPSISLLRCRWPWTDSETRCQGWTWGTALTWGPTSRGISRSGRHGCEPPSPSHSAQVSAG
jgi:hypothetical protein